MGSPRAGGAGDLADDHHLAGFTVRLDDSTGPAWNYRTGFTLGVVALVMGVVLAVRVSFDVRREERDQSDQPG